MNNSDNPIPVIINMHVEPKGHFIGLDEDYGNNGFAESIIEIDKFREQFDKRNQPFNVQWLVKQDYQIEKVYGSMNMPLERYSKEFESVLKLGDVIGQHVHAHRWKDATNTWMVDLEDQEFINELLSISCKNYKQFFGTGPTCYSMGDVWMNAETLQQLEKLGYKYEYSGIPGRKPKAFPTYHGQFKGAPSDFSNLPEHPIPITQFNNEGINNNSPSGLWLIPMTSGQWKGNFYLKEAIKRVIKSRNLKGQFLSRDKFQIRSGIAAEKSIIHQKVRGNPTHFAFECRTALLGHELGRNRFRELVQFFSEEIEGRKFEFVTSDRLMQLYHQSHLSQV